MNVKRLILVLGLAGFIVMADNWVVSPLLPTVAREFSVDPARAGVLIAAYMLPFGLFQLLYGPLADRFGKLRVVTISLALFTVATALCASATGLADLTAFRALTGVFAAATMPVSLALIGDLVPMQGRQKAIATFMGIAFLGQATSMTIGGTIAALSSWRGVFVVYAAVAVVIVVALFVTTRGMAAQLKGDPHSEFLRPYGRLLAHGPSLRTYLVVFVEGLLILGSFSYAGAYADKVLGLETLRHRPADGRLRRRRDRRQPTVRDGWRSASDGRASWPSASARPRLPIFFWPRPARTSPPSPSRSCCSGSGFMFAHSSLLTTATQFAEKARGAAMSLIAFAFMVGGSLGTMLGGRIILGASYRDLYLSFGVALVALGVVAMVAVPAQGSSRESAAPPPPADRGSLTANGPTRRPPGPGVS